MFMSFFPFCYDRCLIVQSVKWTAKKKRRDLLEKGNVPQAQRVIGISRARTAAPTLNEKEEFYKQLAKGKTKPTVLSLIPEHNNAYVPRQPSANLPKATDRAFC